ncbi:MAG: glucose-6-phosphate isomerase [Actinomycetia bacterium]|nr:glucose-6-phosphate isomerase [Actinomycetes bacterium]
MGHDRFQQPAGAALRSHQKTVAGLHLGDLLTDVDRPASMTLAAGPLTVDFSRMLGDPTTLHLLADLAAELDVPRQLAAMASGAPVNTTEGRAALHTALRASATPPILVAGQDVLPDVARTAARVSDFVEAVATGARPGSSGTRITDVIFIGIGGSDLGPRMVAAATRQHHTRQVLAHFIANVDPAELDAVLPRLDPSTTLVVVISKTFTTVETLANAAAARAWLVEGVGETALSHHLAAVTTAIDQAAAFGVPADAVFGFHDWVGGRFSLSSAVGIGIEFAIGRTGMRALREGMRAVDTALLDDPAPQNAALLLGMLDVWYAQYFRAVSKVVVPYSQDLALLPSHLQQLQMESNGKSVTADGDPVSWPTSPVVWGAPGTNGQHAFFQLLHQGTHLVPVDLIGIRSTIGNERAELLQANLLAQAAALALGRTASALETAGVDPALVPHKVMPGNRPSTLIWLPDLSPHSVGALIALYEHATAAAGFAWGVDPFDQWGVERGKELASALLPAVTGGPVPHGTDAATVASLAYLRGY